MTLIFLVLCPSILSTHAVAPAYLPSATPGQFAQYKVLKDSCQSLFVGVCNSLGASLNDTAYAGVQVVGVSGPNATLWIISIFKNGTSTRAGGLVNVATGASNFTISSIVTSDYFLFAGKLATPSPLWNTSTAPIINKNDTETVVGSPRNVDFANFTVAGSYSVISYSEAIGLAFDQASGFLIRINLSVTTSIPGTLKLDVTIAMVDNNAWGSAHLPDFDLSADPTNVKTSENTFGNSSIILHRLYGYSGTVSLSAKSSASGISCSFSASNLAMGGSDGSTLSCRGAAGTYTVTVEGSGGYLTHDTSITLTVSTTPKPTRPASNLSVPFIYGGISVAASFAALIVFLFLRRKPHGSEVAPTAPRSANQDRISFLVET